MVVNPTANNTNIVASTAHPCPGDPVNLEADLIAKYVEKMMARESAESVLTVEELVRQGF